MDINSVTIQINEIVDDLILNNINISLRKFINLVKSKLFKIPYVSSIDYFLELNNHENEFIISSFQLMKYKIIDKISLNRDIFNRLEMIEGIDYKQVNNSFIMTANVFKRIMLSSNQSLYYYLILEKITHAYLHYEDRIANINIHKHKCNTSTLNREIEYYEMS